MKQEKNVLGNPQMYCDICGALLVDGLCPNNCLDINTETTNE